MSNTVATCRRCTSISGRGNNIPSYGDKLGAGSMFERATIERQSNVRAGRIMENKAH